MTLAAGIASVGLAALCTASFARAIPAAPPLRVGMSHVNIAVADLDRASADYARLGFALKEGRPHPDGIRNRHVKFRDGTEIELITAPAATDALTRHYRELIAAGDGPAFLSLDVEPTAVAAERVTQAGLPASTSAGHVDFPFESPLGYIFFAGLNQSPTDRPEHFAHVNGASSLAGVTLAGETLEPERTLFHAFGLYDTSCVAADSSRERASAVSARTERCVVLHDAAVVRLREGAAAGRRRIAALEVRVAEVAIPRRALEMAHVPFRADAGARITVEGEITHGVALTFAPGAAHDAR